MSENPSHPPRPSVRRYVHDTTLVSSDDRLIFASMVRAINVCGLAAEVMVTSIQAGAATRFTLYATRRTRAVRNKE